MNLIDKTPDEIKPRLGPNTIKLLETTKEPRHAYVCLEIPKVYREAGGPRVSTGLAFLNVEDQPGQIYNLNDLMTARQAQVCCFGNFPSHDDKQSARVAKYKLYNEPNGVNPWDNLAETCAMHQGRTIGMAKEIAEQTSKYKEELAKANAELEKLKKGAK